MLEGFKEIPGYDGRYFINEQGQVWSVAKGRLMSPQTDATHPYPWVLLTRPDKKKQPKTRQRKDPEIRAIEQRLLESLGTKVEVKGSLQAGKIEVSYFSQEDLERLIDILSADLE